MRSRLVVCVVGSALLLPIMMVSPAYAAEQSAGQPGRGRPSDPNHSTIDESRLDQSRQPDTAAQAAAARQGLSVRWDPGTGLPRRVTSPNGALATVTGDRGKAALRFVDESREVFGLSEADARGLEVAKTYTDGNGITYVYVTQRDGNRRVFGGGAIATFDAAGALVAGVSRTRGPSGGRPPRRTPAWASRARSPACGPSAARARSRPATSATPRPICSARSAPPAAWGPAWSCPSPTPQP